MTCTLRLALIAALSMAGLPFVVGRAQHAASKNEFFTGKVVPSADVAAKLNTKTDAAYALVADNGKAYPLVNAGARMFTKDKRLLNRPMRLTARLDPKSGSLQVIYVHSLKSGKLHDLFYWCDICTIRGYENTICDCCGDPMVLKETEVEGKSQK